MVLCILATTQRMLRTDECRDCYNVFDKKWYNFNDERVSQLRSMKKESNSAYVLFYVRQKDKHYVERVVRSKFKLD